MNLTQMVEATADKAEANENEMYCKTSDVPPRQPLTAEMVRAHTDFVLIKVNQAKTDVKIRISELRKELYELEKELERLNKIPEKL